MPRISHDVKAENRGKSGQEQSLIDLRQRKAVVPVSGAAAFAVSAIGA